MSKKYTILNTKFNTVELIREDFSFSKDFIEKAKKNWEKNPGKYDGIVMGVKSFSITGKELKIQIFPMNYSWHKYISKSITKSEISEKEKIFPLCLVGLSYLNSKNGKKFIMGIKKSGNIGSGDIECIPQGFCDMKEGDLQNYLSNMLSQELHEELGKDIKLREFKVKALVTDDENSQYALIIEFEVKEEEIKKYLGKEGNEHEKIILVEESEVEKMIENPSAFMASKGVKSNQNIKIGSMTEAALYLYNPNLF
jgi:hypothetical protein